MPFAHLDSRGGQVLVRPVDAIRWVLHEDVIYYGETQTFTVPAGYVTDFASVPRVAVWLIPRFGSYTKAAILHDFLLTHCVASGLISSVDADGLFRRALRELGVPKFRRAMMWTGVRWAAAFSKTRRPGWWSTFPRMLAGTLAFLLTIIPPLVMILIVPALIVWGAVEAVVTLLSPGDKPTTGSLST